MAISESRFAQEGIQTKRNAMTSNHAIAVLQALTFNFTMTISSVAIGRNAVNDESARSVDQKSGFEKPFPTGRARTIGMIITAKRICNVLSASFRMYHESGPITVQINPPIISGNTTPERRHSNQI